MTTSVRYSHSSAPALAFLKQRGNDIDVFVEDSANPNVWLNYIRGHLPRGKHIESVIALGGRSAVENACMADQTSTGRPKLYIIDSDLDLINGTAKKRLKYFYKLPFYSIENAVISEETLCHVAMACSPKKSKTTCLSQIKYKDFEDNLQTTMRKLFTVYAVAKNFNYTGKTISLKANKLFLTGAPDYFYSKPKTSARCIGILKEILRNNDVSKVRKNYEKIRGRANSLPPMQFVAGKEYILSPYRLKFRSIFGLRDDLDQFLVRLSQAEGLIIQTSLKRKLAKSLKNS